MNQYTSKAEKLPERLAAKRMSIETFDIVLRYGVHVPCRERVGSEVMVNMRCGVRFMLHKAKTKACRKVSSTYLLRNSAEVCIRLGVGSDIRY